MGGSGQLQMVLRVNQIKSCVNHVNSKNTIWSITDKVSTLIMRGQLIIRNKGESRGNNAQETRGNAGQQRTGIQPTNDRMFKMIVTKKRESQEVNTVAPGDGILSATMQGVDQRWWRRWIVKTESGGIDRSGIQTCQVFFICRWQ